MAKQLPKRSEVAAKDTWDLSSLFVSDKAWEKEFKLVEQEMNKLELYKGRLQESANTLLEVLEISSDLNRRLGRLYVYAQQKLDTDTTDSNCQKMYGRVQFLDVKLTSAASYLEPEILTIPAAILAQYMESGNGLAEYAAFVENITRQREHTLSAELEEVLSKVSEFSNGASEIFGMFHNADVKFGTVVNEEGEEMELTHGRYTRLLESRDRAVRKQAFCQLYASYQHFENTLAVTYQTNVKATCFYAQIRKYGSAREASLDSSNIPVEVYDNLVAVIRRNLPLLHRYVALRKKLLGVEELHMYDLYTPIVGDMEQKFTFEQAKEMVREAFKPLGEEYLSILEEGFSNRWIDVYENQGKRSGAYSFGSYDSNPYVLMNFDSSLKNVFTLAHEMGHAIHSYYSRKNQNYVNSQYRLFVAEVASTCNESLLIHSLLANCTKGRKRAYLINYFMEEFRGTTFRQTMFAEFEMIVHKMVENGEALNSEILKEIYHRLNVEYFGDAVVVDSEIDMEWARIPHFYNDFYVYQYATGFSAAVALSKRILEQGEEAVKDYIQFLKGGCSKYPIALLKMAGVDMTTPAPIEAAMQMFGELLDEFERLMEE